MSILENVQKHRRAVIAAVMVVVFLAAAGVWYVHRHHGSEGYKGAGHEQTLYTCPMHPSYISDRPGKCPICGMDLVPVKPPESTSEPARKEDASGAAPRVSISIDADKQQSIGVKTARVTRGPAVLTIRASGRVAYDQDLVVAEREFLEAKRSGDASLAKAARERLRLMGIGDDEVSNLIRSGKPDQNLVLAGKKAWIYAPVYENELPFVKTGQNASIELPGGSSIGNGTVRAIDPVIDPATRTARARIEVDNPNGQLRPNMFVNATIGLDLGEKLLVPRSAVISTGERNIVFMVQDGVRFTPKDVVLGPELKDAYVVESGLNEGDVVATSALFLIDSESQMKAAK